MSAKIDGRRLRELRIRKGWTLARLAARSGMSERALQDIENGLTRHPRPNTVRWISEALGVEPESLWCDEAGAARSEVPPALGHLVVRDRTGSVLTSWDIRRERIQIGRDAANDVVLPDLRVSLFHALIVLRGQLLELRDLSSANGTCVNGDSVKQPRTLHEGDQIQIAGFSLEFCPASSARDSATATVRTPPLKLDGTDDSQG